MLYWKKDKCVDVKNIRTLCLIEVDFNHNNKKLGRDIINFAERNKLHPPWTVWQQEDKRAIDQAIHKRLLYDIINLQRRPQLLCSNNALTPLL